MAFELPALPNLQTNIPQPPSALDQYGRMLQLKALSGQTQLQPLQLQAEQEQVKQQQLQTQEMQLQQQSQQAMMKAWSDPEFTKSFTGTDASDASGLGFDPQAMTKALISKGVLPKDALAMTAQFVDRSQKIATALKDQAQTQEANAATRDKGYTVLANQIGGILDAPASKAGDMLASLKQDLVKNPQKYAGIPQEDLAHVLNADLEHLPAMSTLIGLDAKIADFHKSKFDAEAAANKLPGPNGELSVDNQQGLQKEIALATNPQVQQGKVNVAAAEGAARQNAINNPQVPGNPSLQGPAYIQTLPQPMQSLVTEIGTGKMALSRLDYLLSRNPAVMAAVAQAYPDFDSSKVQSYINTYKDFTSGPTSKSLNAGGTALGHLKELQELNTDASHIPHTPAWTAYQNKATTVATELAKFYGDATVSGIDAIKQTLVSTLPGNRDKAILTQAQSMGDKLDAYEQQWRNAAPSKEYQAPLPGISQQAKDARAALDPKYAARVKQESGGGKTISLAIIQQAAKDHGVSVDEAKKQAIAQGYTIQ